MVVGMAFLQSPGGEGVVKGKLFWRGESECKGPGVGASAIIWGTNKRGGGQEE